MIDLSALGKLNFMDQGGIASLDTMLSEVAGFVETRTAAEIASILWKKCEHDAALTSALAPFIAKFRVLALPVLTDEQAGSVFSSVATILKDERIGLYERLRARLLVLPESRRISFAQQIVTSLRQSSEVLGSASVGTWVGKIEAAGPAGTDAFFKSPEFEALNDETNHAIRHLAHVVVLLLAPDQVLSAPTQRTGPSKPMTPATPPVTPLSPIRSVPLAPSAPAPTAPTMPPPAPDFPTRPSMAGVVTQLRADAKSSLAAPSVAHLTPEDHQEIAGHIERLEHIDAGPNVHDIISTTLEEMVADLKIDFPEDNLKRRFMTIMTSRLKDIRSANETTELLTRPVKVGGLGYDPALAARVVDAASKVASRFSDQNEVRRMAEDQEAKQAIPMPKPPKVPAAPQLETAPVAPQPVAPPPPLAQPAVQPSLDRASATMRPSAAQAPVAFRSAMAQPMTPISLRGVDAERPTMSDIRGTSRLTGPVEELRQMSIADYRRLGADAVAVIRRVYEKIQRLGKESFTKRAEGISAWRESDVYKLYLTMGHESLATNKTIRDISASRQQQGQPSLSEEEFSLIADLNRKLRF